MAQPMRWTRARCRPSWSLCPSTSWRCTPTRRQGARLLLLHLIVQSSYSPFYSRTGTRDTDFWCPCLLPELRQTSGSGQPVLYADKKARATAPPSVPGGAQRVVSYKSLIKLLPPSPLHCADDCGCGGRRNLMNFASSQLLISHGAPLSLCADDCGCGGRRHFTHLQAVSY